MVEIYTVTALSQMRTIIAARMTEAERNALELGGDVLEPVKRVRDGGWRAQWAPY